MLLKAGPGVGGDARHENDTTKPPKRNRKACGPGADRRNPEAAVATSVVRHWRGKQAVQTDCLRGEDAGDSSRWSKQCALTRVPHNVLAVLADCSLCLHVFAIRGAL